MENQVSPNSNSPSDEIDLGQLFKMIGNGFKNLFKTFLRLFVYLKKNVVKLGILIVIGLAIGYGLNQIVTKKLKTEVIVKPNLESKSYLYSVVGEIQTNVKARDTSFFREMGVGIEDLKGFEVTIEPVEKSTTEAIIDDDVEYLELLQKFRNDDLILDIVRTEILNRSNLNHRITFFYKDAKIGKSLSENLMNYINSNEYFNDLVAINRNNAEERIKQDQNLVKQIDNLVEQFSEKMTRSGQNGEGRIVLDSEDPLDITGILNLKNNLIRDIERKKLELQGEKEAIRIINFGKTQEVQKSFLGKNIVLVPSLLLLLFFLIDILKYLNLKSKEMQL
ncbi:hypothetical protein [Muriicola sp. Z0-33]|uniref:hypothetical protein n=1 Tax=Muriicola sp. Z0-33 TaxID=2816957 RepID=UPI002237B41B|nr:hypothetical protein [Muriicola sp. Z0-33]MCW5514655.1 hypothetical protein [Muriicola sp. Z0-33]